MRSIYNFSVLDLLKIRKKAGRRGTGAEAAAAAGESTTAAGKPATSPAPPGEPFIEAVKLIPEVQVPAPRRAKETPAPVPKREPDAARAEPRQAATAKPATDSFNPEVSYPTPPPPTDTDQHVAMRRPSGSSREGASSTAGNTPEETQLARALIVSASEAAAAEPEAEKPAAPLYDPERELTNRFLLCRVHGETFAVPIGEILEILRERPLTPVPLTGSALAGVLSLRGRMVPVIDAALRLGFPAAVSDELTRIVVFEQSEEWIGLRVAGVGQVSTIAPDSLQHPGAALGEANAEMLSGVTRTGDGFVAVPVLARLLEVAR